MTSPSVRRILLACLLVTLPGAAFSQSSSLSPTNPGGIVVERDLVIGKGGTQDLHANLAYPKEGSKLLPAIIYIHGGGWIGGSYKDCDVARLAKAGYFSASIEYRLSNVAKWPAQIQDCKLAVRWLRANAAKYHVDPNRIGVWGASAGGHLVACLGTMADVKEYEGEGGYPEVSSSVQAVVDYFGPTDFTYRTTYSEDAKKLTEGLFGVPRDQNEALWKSGSPTFYVKPNDPPMLLIHGDADTLVPLSQSTVFDEALTKAGVPHELIIVKNGTHGFGPVPGTTVSPTQQEIALATMAFFEKHLKTGRLPK